VSDDDDEEEEEDDDEEEEEEDEDDEQDAPPPPPKANPPKPGPPSTASGRPPQQTGPNPRSSPTQEQATAGVPRPPMQPMQPMQKLNATGGSGDDESSEEEDDEHGTSEGAGGDLGYNPAEYASLPVSAEIKELFQYIGRYKPHSIELETRVKPFIPDYIPAVGDIDAFIKIPRPDGKTDGLGAAVLDEPTANQSDPTVLQLQMRAMSKQSNLQPMSVRSIESAEKNSKAINAWITSLNDLHRSKPPPSVSYSKNMPDIEQLMQVWPDEFERLLSTTKLPSADLDVDLKTYARIVCGILDIPVYTNIVESLHVLFTLYTEFKSNPHFQQQALGVLPPEQQAYPQGPVQ